MPNRHWRCGELNKVDGKHCKNIVENKGDLCYRHRDEEKITFTQLIQAHEAESSGNVPNTKPERTRQVTVKVCDGCGKDVFPDADDVYNGYHGGKVFNAGEWGGVAADDWFACSEGCIVQAIAAVLAYSWEH